MQQNRVKKMRQPEARLVVEAIADHRLPRRFNTALLYDRLGVTLNGRTIGPRGHLPKPFNEALNLPLDLNQDYQPRSDVDALDLVQGELVIGVVVEPGGLGGLMGGQGAGVFQ